MNPSDVIRIRHMIQAGESAVRFVAGRNREDLDTDEVLRFALVRAAEIIGEAASRVSPETRVQIPSVPWDDAILMRNRLIHAYFNIDLKILWKTVAEDIPMLLVILRPFAPAE